MKNRFIIFQLFFVLIFTKAAFSQTDEVTNQLWVDAIYYYPFAVNYRAKFELGHRSLLNHSDEWQQFVVRPAIEYYPIPFIDILASLGLFYTRQNDASNTREIRPAVGFRLNFLQQRMIIRTNTRFESRNFYYVETKEKEGNWRFRARAELIFPFNNPSIRNPKTLYGLADFEVFADIGDETTERFANRNRLRTGIGWRFDLKWRLEFIYTRQSSFDNFSSSLTTTDNIYRFRLKFQPLRSKQSIQGENN